jgi:phosphohistidine phosphatase
MPGPYELYLIRHGIAEDRGPAWPDDAKRPLTAEGVARMRKGARGLVRLGWKLDVILTSPLTRARQTADVVSDAFTLRPPIVVVDSLAPEGRIPAVAADLEKQARRSRIALVGHEPGMGELAARLMGLPHPLEFKKGAVCRIDVEEMPGEGLGELRWFVTPRLLRSLRR